MSESSKTKNQSPLVKTMINLDDYFSELDRLSTQIEKMDLNSEFELARGQQLMSRFVECGQIISTEIASLSQQLVESRARAEAAAQIVSVRAEQMQSRKNEIQKKINEFQVLGQKVRALSTSLNDLKKPTDEPLSDSERAELTLRLADFDTQLIPIIEETKQLKNDARASKMNDLERQADSLGQSLLASSQKLHCLFDVFDKKAHQ